MRSKDKYLSFFHAKLEAIMFIILQILFATSAGLKIGEYHSDIVLAEAYSVMSRV